MTTIANPRDITSQKPLSNMQLALLKLYATDVSEEDLKVIQRLIARYFAEKATALADADFAEKKIDPDALVNEHIRTPYNKNTAR